VTLPWSDLPWALLATAVGGWAFWFASTADRTPYDPGPLTEREIDEHAASTVKHLEAYATQEHRAGRRADGRP
jgi:hypothetical protein